MKKKALLILIATTCLIWFLLNTTPEREKEVVRYSIPTAPKGVLRSNVLSPREEAFRILDEDGDGNLMNNAFDTHAWISFWMRIKDDHEAIKEVAAVMANAPHEAKFRMLGDLENHLRPLGHKQRGIDWSLDEIIQIIKPWIKSQEVID